MLAPPDRPDEIPQLLERLKQDGSVDASFDPGAGPDSTVRALVLQPDGKIIIGGGFLNYDGIARNRTARLNTNGSLDPSFDHDGKATVDFKGIGGAVANAVTLIRSADDDAPGGAYSADSSHQ